MNGSVWRRVALLGVVCAWAGGIAFGWWLHSTTAVVEVARERPVAVALVEQHGCWTGAAPADMEGKVPGHVVVTRAGGLPEYAGAATVRDALQQTFEGVDHDLVVHAFCR